MAISYKFIKNSITKELANVIQKTDDDGKISFVAKDEANTDYQEYLDWVAEGNTPEAAD